MSSTRPVFPVFAAWLTLCGLLVPAIPAQAQVLFGALSNFDCFNDTGQVAHGFEIELDGLSSANVVYTFASPYIRYGVPSKVDFAGGVYVRYESPYDVANKVFTQTTPIPSSISPTAGHQCWTGGSTGYLASGCEHFGLSLTKNPTKTVYHWLLADAARPGFLVRAGSQVPIPAPVWTVVPPAVPAAAPVVQAVVQPLPAPDAFEFGEAQWVKVFEKELPEKVPLNNLVTDDPAVPNLPVETEIEWTILQADKNRVGGGELDNAKPLGAGSGSVIRRYEFYKYTGLYDAQTHEALCAVSCVAPQPAELGTYIGAQMAAALVSNASAVAGMRVTTSGFLYSRFTRSWIGTVTVTNTSGQAVAGPVEVVFTSLPAGVALLNPAGVFQGDPYLVIPTLATAGSSFAGNRTVAISVQFTASAAISFNPVVYTGSIQ